MSSTDSSEKYAMRTKSDNIEFMIGSDTYGIIQTLFNSLLERDQEGLEKSMKSSHFFFDYADGLHCKRHKISLRWSTSHIDSPK